MSTNDVPMTFGVEEETENKVEGVMSDLAEAALNELNNVAPESAKNYVKKAKDMVRPAEKFVEKMMPHLLKTYDVVAGAWSGAAQYQPLQYSSILVGLLMVFFGGTFGATIAAAETFSHLAMKDTKEALNILYSQYKIADAAAEKDEDANPLTSNATDAQKRDAELRRRALVIFKSIDPDAISKALGAMWSGLFGVVCALRVKFAHAVTLGVSIGDMTSGLFHRYGEKYLIDMFPESLHKWVPMLSRYLCRAFSVSLAWTLQVIIVAFHASLRGANMFVGGLATVLVQRGLVQQKSLPPKESARWNTIVYIVAAVGFWFQAKVRCFVSRYVVVVYTLLLLMFLTVLFIVLLFFLFLFFAIQSGFSVPFPLNLVLWPISFFEFTLKLLVGTYDM